MSADRPGMRDVVAEQFRYVALAARNETLMMLLVLVASTIAIANTIVYDNIVVDFDPENDFMFPALGFLLPFALWKERDRQPTAQFWVMPVEHRRHALARFFAGWLWLMVIVALIALWVAVFVVASGGSFTPVAERLVMRAAEWPLNPTLADFDAVMAPSPRWGWVAPITSSTIAYTMTSAFVLATRNPLQWLAGVVVGVLLLGFATAEGAFEVLDTVFSALLSYPWGLDTVFLGGENSLNTMLPGPAGEQIRVWRGLPQFDAWLKATLLWAVVAAVALWAATRRLRERST